MTPYTWPDGTSGTNVHAKADKDHDLVAADVPQSVVGLMIATQRPIALATLNDNFTSAALGDQTDLANQALLDPVIPRAEFDFEADRAHSRRTNP